MKLIFLLIFSILFINAASASPSQIKSWKKYPYHQSGSKIHFPKDEGKHSMFPNLEWWYTVIHATGETTGEHYSILVTHFNNRFRFFTVTNLERKQHISGTTQGKLESKKGYLDLKHKTKYGTDIFRSKKDLNGELIPFEYEIKTHHDKMKLEVSLSALKRPLMVGGQGYMPVGKSGKTWYYSLTRLQALGKLTINGFTENIKGNAWMDHQWGPFFVSPVSIGNLFESYEWFCLQLDDGTDIMISNIYDRKFNLPMKVGYSGVDMMNSKGESKFTHIKEFKRNKFWQDPVSGSYMSMGWELKVPEWDLDLKMVPDFVEQMVKFPFKGDFWEGSIGVTGTHNGKEVIGKAFGELIHRFKKPKVKFKRLVVNRNAKKIQISWQLKNTDAGNPITYDLSILGENGTLKTVLNLDQTNYEVPFSVLKNLKTKKGTTIKVKIIAHSIDHTISSETHSMELQIY